MDMGKEKVSLLQSYQTSDLGLASYLYTSGCSIFSIVSSNGRSLFTFNSPDIDIKELVMNWQKGEATVNAVAYNNNLAMMKRMAIEGKTD